MSQYVPMFIVQELLGLGEKKKIEGIILCKGNGRVSTDGSSSHVHVFLHVTREHSFVYLAVYLVDESIEESLVHLFPADL